MIGLGSRTLAVLTLLCATLGATRSLRAASRETVLVLPSSGQNVSAAFVTWAHDLLVARLGAQSLIIDRDGPPKAAPPPGAQVAAAALAAGADLGVTLHIQHAVGQQTDVTMEVRDARTGAVVFGGTERVRGGPNELPGAIDRLVFRFPREREGRQLVPARPAVAPPACGAAAPARYLFAGVRFGALIPIGNAGGSPTALPAGGLFLLTRPSRAMWELFFDHAYRDEDASVTTFGVGVHALSHPPAPDGTVRPAATLGAAMAWSNLQIGGRGAAGLSARAALGLLWPFRGLILRAEAAYVSTLFDEHEPDRLIPGSGAGHRTHGPHLSLGVAF